jgi:hypothetical protein
MKRFGFIVVLMLWMTASVWGYDKGDWQFWPRITLEGKLSTQWCVLLDEEWKSGDDMKEIFDHRSDLGISYQLKKWLQLGVNYWHSYSKKNNSWSQEKRPHFNIIFKHKIGKIMFTDRNRFDYRMIEKKDSYWRYRNLFSIAPAFKLTKLQIAPYIEDEIFYDLKTKEIAEDRIYLGFRIPLLKNITTDFYYLRQYKQEQDWINYNIFGAKVKIVFER